MKIKVDPKDLISLKESPFVGVQTQNGNKLIFLKDDKDSIFSTCLHDVYAHDHKNTNLPKVASDPLFCKCFIFDSSIEMIQWTLQGI